MRTAYFVVAVMLIVGILPLAGVLLGYFLGRSKSKREKQHWLFK